MIKKKKKSTKAQLHKIAQSGEFLGKLLGPLLKTFNRKCT